ncbi:MAG TPA: amidase [Thermoanaerobaculia bacterium]|nr:amidase [Thermoanaerobaculia bacterium]
MAGLDLDRLRDRFEQREPSVHAFVPEDGRFGRLQREMDEALAAFPDSQPRGPLFGVPIGVKDVFHVNGLPTRAGSRLPPEELSGPEAEVVSRLRGLGALILGKAVCTEFAFFAPGPTRNPHDPEHTPGGSSSGSAAAVAAGLCPAALGTQTIGSIIRPAAYCGVVGFKPSYGRIPTAGLIPLAPSLDHVGFLTIDVQTAINLAVGLMDDYGSQGVPARPPVLGIPEGPYLSRASEEGLAHFREICLRLSSRYEVRSVPAMADFAEIEARHFRITAAEAARVHQDWFPRFRDLYAVQTVDLIERGQKVPSDQLERELAGREELRGELTGLMDEHGIDLWLSPPAQGPAPRGLASTGSPVMNLPWTQAGLPVLGVPAGSDAEGLPMGLQVTGRWRTDELLLHWGGEIAQEVAA